MYYYLFGAGNGWVGWRKESFSKKGYVELIFEFNEVRNFSAVHLYTNNFFSKNVQVSGGRPARKRTRRMRPVC